MLATVFSPDKIKTFRIKSWNHNHQTGEVTLQYGFDDEYSFAEKIVLPPSQDLPAKRKEALERCIGLLHLVAGVSYYKAAAPNRISVETGPIAPETYELVSLLYGVGLGEFAYVNHIPIPAPEFQVEVAGGISAPGLQLSQRSLVAVGGGKDSCVSIELVRSINEEIVLASVNKWKPIIEVIDAAQLPSTHARRKLAPEIFEINSDGALNGHVPITSIVSLVLVALAVINDCDAIVMSNERSASVGNLWHDGVVVNHQFSKSFQVERRLAEVVKKTVAADLKYFSFLRPLSELEIARRFATDTRYDQVFTSCNRAFRIAEQHRIDHWCCDCPKCRFVFLALAPFTTPDRLVAIFGKNMLEDSSQFSGFDALIGWQADKPFECVGEVEESIAAFLKLLKSEAWRSSVAVRRFEQEIRPNLALPSDIETKPFTFSESHAIPQRFLKAFNETR